MNITKWKAQRKARKFFELLEYWEHDADFENVLVFYLSLKNTVYRLEEKYGDRLDPVKIVAGNECQKETK